MAQNLPARSGSATTRQGTAVWSPLAEMGELYARMSQLMHAAWGHGWHWSGQAWAPLADLRETDDAYVVELDLPGVKKDDITVELSGNELVVTGDLADGADGQSSRRIRRSGHIEQRVLLPAAPAEADKVTASLSDGVLTVTVPKSEGDKPRRVEVTSS
jgi:HSP20 family protein